MLGEKAAQHGRVFRGNRIPAMGPFRRCGRRVDGGHAAASRSGEKRVDRLITVPLVTYVLPLGVPEIELQEFLDAAGRSAFARWFEGLNAVAAARVTVALTRLGQGNFSNVEGVGSGVCELKIDFGPGYRIYFGKDGERIVILLGGSSKKRQSAAIAAAQAAWVEYKRRKGGKG